MVWLTREKSGTRRESVFPTSVGGSQILSFCSSSSTSCSSHSSFSSSSYSSLSSHFYCARPLITCCTYLLHLLCCASLLHLIAAISLYCRNSPLCDPSFPIASSSALSSVSARPASVSAFCIVAVRPPYVALVTDSLILRPSCRRKSPTLWSLVSDRLVCHYV